MKNTKITKNVAIILTAGVLAITTAPGIVFAKTDSEVKNIDSIETEQNDDNAREVKGEKSCVINAVMSNFVDSKDELDKIDEIESNKNIKNKKVNSLKDEVLLNYLLNYVRAKGAFEEGVSLTDVIAVCYYKRNEDDKSYKFGYKIKNDFDKKYIDENNNYVRKYDTKNNNKKIILNVKSNETVYENKDGKHVCDSPVNSLENPKEANVEWISDELNKKFDNILNKHKISSVMKELTTDQINYGISSLLKEYNNQEESKVKTK